MKDRKRLRRRILPLLAALLLAAEAPGALASGSWISFTTDSVPENLGFLVQEYTGTVRVTFLGDCTLGGEERNRNAYRGFVRMIERNGYAWPFRNLTALTAADDLTVANLEGVLSDRNLTRVSKEFNLIKERHLPGYLIKLFGLSSELSLVGDAYLLNESLHVFIHALHLILHGKKQCYDCFLSKFIQFFFSVFMRHINSFPYVYCTGNTHK